MIRAARSVAGLLLGCFALALAGSAAPDRPVPVVAARAPHVDVVKETFERAALMLHARQYEHAAVAFAHLAERAPRIAEVHANLGYAFVGLGQWPQAQAAFEQALEINPRLANAYYGLSLSAEARGDRAFALGAMRSFVHLARAGDPFVAKARAALWEWQASQEPNAPKAPQRADWRGRIAIVNVWAVWCEPCRAEMPALQRLADALPEDRFVVAGVAAQSDGFVVREWLRQYRIRFDNVLDGDGSFVRREFDARAYPLTVVLDTDGRELMRFSGPQAWDDPALRTRLRRIAAAAVAPHNPTVQSVDGPSS